MEQEYPRHLKAARYLIIGLGVWMVFSTTALLILAELSGKPVFRAVLRMGGGLVYLWCLLGGAVMYLGRDRVRRIVLSLPGWRPVKFVVFCTFLALVEEAVTTTMTNLAPFFGVPMGKAYITASANYLDVVCYHSVIIFIPWFVGWAWMLSRWDFHPAWVFLLFGLTGTIAETNFLTRNPLEIGMWVYVYGLMIYLPAYSLPEGRSTRPPRWWHYPLAVVVPFPFMILLLPVGVMRSLLHLHPDPSGIHFPPIQMDP